MEPSSLKKLNTLKIKLSNLGETGCLSNLYYLLAAQAPSFLIYPCFPNAVSQTKLDSLHHSATLA